MQGRNAALSRAQNNNSLEVESETALWPLRFLQALGKQTEKGVRVLGS